MAKAGRGTIEASIGAMLNDIYMHLCAQHKKSLGTPHESKAMRNEFKGIHTDKKPVETRKKEIPSAIQDTPASCSLFRHAAFLVLCTRIRHSGR